MVPDKFARATEQVIESIISSPMYENIVQQFPTKNKMKIASYNENRKIYLWLTFDFRKLLCILRLQRVYWILCTTFNKLGHNLDHKKAGY